MISERHNCIFIHIPKTGGQSVESVFMTANGLTWETRAPLLLRRNKDPAQGPERLAHLTAREYVSCGHVDRTRFDGCFKFAFVRNPWDRLVSEYRYRKLNAPFRVFVEEVLAPGFSDGFSDRARHIKPQADFLTDERGNVIVDFIGRFENLAADFAHVADKLGVPASLPHANSSRRRFQRSYQKYYDAELRDRVARFYAEDIERFGYAFG